MQRKEGKRGWKNKWQDNRGFSLPDACSECFSFLLNNTFCRNFALEKSWECFNRSQSSQICKTLLSQGMTLGVVLPTQPGKQGDKRGFELRWAGLPQAGGFLPNFCKTEFSGVCLSFINQLLLSFSPSYRVKAPFPLFAAWSLFPTLFGNFYFPP